jgi:hypothetical protein
MLRCALEVGEMDLNRIYDTVTKETRWTNLIRHVCSSKIGDSEMHWNIVERGLFSLLLQHGADPNALVYCGRKRGGNIPCFSTSWFDSLLLLFKLRPKDIANI